MRTDQVRREAKAGPLWDVWVRHGILTQDRGRGESPLRHFRRSDPREIRQKRLDALAAQIGSPAPGVPLAAESVGCARSGKRCRA
jgi:hypothetical protein